MTASADGAKTTGRKRKESSDPPKAPTSTKVRKARATTVLWKHNPNWDLRLLAILRKDEKMCASLFGTAPVIMPNGTKVKARVFGESKSSVHARLAEGIWDCAEEMPDNRVSFRDHKDHYVTSLSHRITTYVF
jgi:hypothetical protein